MKERYKRSSRFQRRDYDIEIHQRAGEGMKHVDALSRSPMEESDEILENATAYNTMVSENEILMYVVPRAMRKALVVKNHDLSSHFGVDRTVARIRSYYYFPRMRSYVRRHIAACVECLFAKHKAGRQAGDLNFIPVGNRPFEIVHLDYLGPFVTMSRGNKYILAIIGRLTKFCQLFAVSNVKAATMEHKVESFIDRFGAPNRFIVDRGTAFTADGFKNCCQKHGIKITFTLSRHAQANGQVERLNQTIRPALQTGLTDFEGRH